MAMFTKTLFAAALTAGIVLPGAVFAQTALTAKFTDPAWDGQAVPAGQQCSLNGGQGSTPSLELSGVPDGTTQIVLAFNDETYTPMDNGGHGVIGFDVAPVGGVVTLPAAPGETDALPTGVSVLKKNLGTGAYDKPGYLPPCSGGNGNLYTVTITAIDAAGAKVSAAEIELGRY
jgi:hypothetical protein